MNLICVEEEEGSGTGTAWAGAGSAWAGAWTGAAEDEAGAIYDVGEGVVDGAGTRLCITGRMLLAATR